MLARSVRRPGWARGVAAEEQERCSSGSERRSRLEGDVEPGSAVLEVEPRDERDGDRRACGSQRTADRQPSQLQHTRTSRGPVPAGRPVRLDRLPFRLWPYYLGRRRHCSNQLRSIRRAGTGRLSAYCCRRTRPGRSYGDLVGQVPLDPQAKLRLRVVLGPSRSAPSTPQAAQHDPQLGRGVRAAARKQRLTSPAALSRSGLSPPLDASRRANRVHLGRAKRRGRCE